MKKIVLLASLFLVTATQPASAQILTVPVTPPQLRQGLMFTFQETPDVQAMMAPYQPYLDCVAVRWSRYELALATFCNPDGPFDVYLLCASNYAATRDRAFVNSCLCLFPGNDANPACTDACVKDKITCDIDYDYEYLDCEVRGVDKRKVCRQRWSAGRNWCAQNLTNCQNPPPGPTT